MSDDDGIIVKQAGEGEVQLTVNDEEFLVKLNEDEEMEDSEETDVTEEEDADAEAEVTEGEDDEECEVKEGDEKEEEVTEGDEPLYEIEFDDTDGGVDITGDDEFDIDLGGDDFSDSITTDDEIIDDSVEMFEDEEGVDAEMKETARTIGMGNRKGALPKGSRVAAKANPTLNKEHVELKKQVKVLREKNEEYKKALTLFREKLNEVAVFNANLAYATRLFTEHATTKPEKMNILKRFDETSTLKESKQLYKTLKNELNTKTTVTESVVEKIIQTPSKGSASSTSKEILAESQAYTSPQFARMKDLFAKLK